MRTTYAVNRDNSVTLSYDNNGSRLARTFSLHTTYVTGAVEVGYVWEGDRQVCGALLGSGETLRCLIRGTYKNNLLALIKREFRKNRAYHKID